MKLKISNDDKTPKLKLWLNSKTQIVTKLKKKSSCDYTQIVTKLKLWQNSNCDSTQIVTTQIVTKLKPQIVTQLKHFICDKTKKTQTVIKLQLGQILIYDEKYSRRVF